MKEDEVIVVEKMIEQKIKYQRKWMEKTMKNQRK